MPILGALKGSHLNIFGSLHEFDLITEWAPVVCSLHRTLADTASFQNFPVAITMVHRVTDRVEAMNLRVV